MTRKSIHWESVRTRLRSSEIALHEALSATPEQVERAYHARGLRLASQQNQRGATSPGIRALIVWSGGERYAIEQKDVSEVLDLARCAPVPGTPAQFLGVMNVRGDLRPVLDLSVVLGLARPDPKRAGFVLMLSHQGQEIGLKVDGIDALREVGLENMISANHGKFAKGLLSSTLVLLDIQRMLVEVVSQEEES